MRTSFPLLALFAVATTGVVTSAGADELPFGARAGTVLVVDHLVGVTRATVSEVDDDQSYDITQVGTSMTIVPFAGSATMFGVHQFVTENISIGAGVQYASASGALSKYTVLGLHPRIGFAIPLSPTSAFWLRAGGGYTHWDYAKDNSEDDLSVGGEAFYVFTPVSHFGLTFGPMIDHTLSAKYKNDNGSETKLQRTIFGATMGLLFDL